MVKRIVVGMSGGVDSSMAALLLKRQGWEPVGVTLLLPRWEAGCFRETASEEPQNAAKAVCRELRIPHHVLDARNDFCGRVIDKFVSGLSKGVTPNPCAICNRDFKFSKLLEFAGARGIRFIATGHYARTRLNSETGKAELLRARDAAKDQTYGMCLVSGEILSRIVFPLGELTKREVYALAKKGGFPGLLEKRQSQDLCFVANKDVPGFLREKIGKKPGPIRDAEGKVLGRHRGLHFFTVGQRRGLGLKGQFYVKSLDPETNSLVVTKEKNGVRMQSAVLRDCGFVSGSPPEGELGVFAQVRSHQPPVEAVIHPPKGGRIRIGFTKPAEAVTPGQVCALYAGEVCLGGGIIE